MIQAALVALLLLALPLALFVAGAVVMMRATGRSRFRQRRRQPESAPLNLRWGGYDVAAAQAYWHWLGAEGAAAERRFLVADMVFPLWYGGAMLASLYTAWARIGPPFSLAWLLAPVIVTVLADWAENLVHLWQLRGFRAGRPLRARWLRFASAATVTKLVFFAAAALLMVLLALWVLVQPML